MARTAIVFLLLVAASLGPRFMPAAETDLMGVLERFQDRLTSLPEPRQFHAMQKADPAMFQTVDIQAPIIQKLQQQLPFLSGSGFTFDSVVVGAKTWCLYLAPRLVLWMWLVPGLCLCFGLVCLAAGQYGLVRSLAGFGESLSQPWLGVLALGTAILAIGARTNPWPALPLVVYVPPALWLAGSAWLQNRADLNAPVWNGVLGGLLGPVISMLGVLVMTKVSQ